MALGLAIDAARAGADRWSPCAPADASLAASLLLHVVRLPAMYGAMLAAPVLAALWVYPKVEGARWTRATALLCGTGQALAMALGSALGAILAARALPGQALPALGAMFGGMVAVMPAFSFLSSTVNPARPAAPCAHRGADVASAVRFNRRRTRSPSGA
jgi:hypothetical protein